MWRRPPSLFCHRASPFRGSGTRPDLSCSPAPRHRGGISVSSPLSWLQSWRCLPSSAASNTRKPDGMRVTILALTLNEITGVQEILPRICREWYDQMIVVDGGSTDGTIEWCREHAYVVHVQRTKGIRFAYLEVLDQIQGDIVVTTSPDGNCDPAGIPALVEAVRNDNDLVIGSRYKGTATSQDDDVVTGFGNWLFTRTVNILHRGSYTDCMVIYRAFRRELIYQLDLDKEQSYVVPERLFGTIISRSQA